MLRPTYPIATERLRLRPFAPGDLDAIMPIHADPDVVRYVPWDVRDRDELREALAKRRGRPSWSTRATGSTSPPSLRGRAS